MALSNKFGHMLLTTGNKSEMSVGYATIYGDMAGGYSVLKDAYKTTVFELSRWRNANRPALALGADGPVMPGRVIDKPPSAELRANQKDSDSLPPYDVLDPILHALVEEELAVSEVVGRGYDRDTVIRIERLLYVAEYKRRQAPPGVKLGERNFGRDRRYPITNAFRSIDDRHAASPRPQPAGCMSAMLRRRCTIGCSRGRRAGGFCCGSMIPMRSGQRSGSSTLSGRI